MAIQFVGYGTGSAALSSTCSFSFDAGSAADRILLVYAATDRGGSQTIDTATYNGVSMSAQTGFVSTITYYDGRLFYLVAPASGSNTLSVQYSTNTINSRVLAMVYSGVNQTVPFDAYAEYKGYSSSLSTTVASEAADMAVAMMVAAYVGTTGATVTSGTERVDELIATTMYALAYDKAGEPSTSLAATLGSNAEYWGVKLNLNIAAGGNAKRALLLGVG